jgi:hypothetical protein
MSRGLGDVFKSQGPHALAEAFYKRIDATAWWGKNRL